MQTTDKPLLARQREVEAFAQSLVLRATGTELEREFPFAAVPTVYKADRADGLAATPRDALLLTFAGRFGRRQQMSTVRRAA